MVRISKNFPFRKFSLVRSLVRFRVSININFVLTFSALIIKNNYFLGNFLINFSNYVYNVYIYNIFMYFHIEVNYIKNVYSNVYLFYFLVIMSYNFFFN